MHCDAPLGGDHPTPWRHQVIEISPIKPVVTEYQWHQLVCVACGEVTRAPWPAGVPSGTYGPGIQATVALYTGAYRLSKRMTQQAMDEMFGVPMVWGRLATWSRPQRQRSRRQSRKPAHTCTGKPWRISTTSWRQGGKRAWLWVAVTSWVTVFLVRMSRGGPVAHELLGGRLPASGDGPLQCLQLVPGAMASGVLGTLFERFRSDAQPWWGLKGDWRRLACAGAPDVYLVASGAQRHTETLQLSFRDIPLRREVERLLEVGSRCGVAKTTGTCRDLLKRREALWTFVQVKGVEPTNNTSESDPPRCTLRKGSFGTQSAEGSRFVESLMTVVATLKQQQRSVLEYLTTACEAALRGEKAPSLLPASAQKSHAAA